jgi:DNA-binding Lrp family transcriptional regulator
MKANEDLREKVLSILMDNSRKSFREIAKELKASTTTISNTVKELERDGAILRYTLKVDWRKLGYNSIFCVQIATTPDADIDSVGKNLRKMPSLKEVFYTTGDMSFSAYVVSKDNEETTSTIQMLRDIPGVERVVPHLVLKVF